jgi:predicted transcriptional regulator
MKNTSSAIDNRPTVDTLMTLMAVWSAILIMEDGKVVRTITSEDLQKDGNDLARLIKACWKKQWKLVIYDV